MGEFDKRGRLRKPWIELLDRLISSAVSIDKALGLARKQKPALDAFEIMRSYDKAQLVQQPVEHTVDDES
jgi:hypothetical protein